MVAKNYQKFKDQYLVPQNDHSASLWHTFGFLVIKSRKLQHNKPWHKKQINK